jgi:hypothetical protein
LQDYDGGISLDKAVRAEAIDSALGLFAFMEEGDYIETLTTLLLQLKMR